ncbi:hypothetical protein GCK72_015615 [Caenorhabditis remanei]|uniref:Uncharacterized protein n=1 Tax=Caenorhabditis remanei TaxID=31234 RepID=A0A6A5GWZ3_CAERE|nr:hypothetical protein GCK72_015615 [Caenorhabditis remanei]KAF1759154.1 hypothetical protein GCK72_015615 [Caenorhabditis remanei]
MVPKSNQVLRALKFEDNINYEGMESVKMGGQHVRVEMDHSDGYIITYWENTTDGSKVITDYVTNLFNIDVSDIWASKQSFHIIQHVISRQKTPLRYPIWIQKNLVIWIRYTTCGWCDSYCMPSADWKVGYCCLARGDS